MDLPRSLLEGSRDREEDESFQTSTLHDLGKMVIIASVRTRVSYQTLKKRLVIHLNIHIAVPFYLSSKQMSVCLLS